jgi:hypothetical protein
MYTRSLRLAPAAIGSEDAQDHPKERLPISYFLFHLNLYLCHPTSPPLFSAREASLTQTAVFGFWIGGIAELNNLR